MIVVLADYLEPHLLLPLLEPTMHYVRKWTWVEGGWGEDLAGGKTGTGTDLKKGRGKPSCSFLIWYSKGPLRLEKYEVWLRESSKSVAAIEFECGPDFLMHRAVHSHQKPFHLEIIYSRKIAFPNCKQPRIKPVFKKQNHLSSWPGLT